MINDISYGAAVTGALDLKNNPALKQNDQLEQLESLLIEMEPILGGLSAKLANGNKHLQDDLKHEGVVAAIQASGKFNSLKGQLSHYAARSARGAMFNHLRWLSKFNREASIHEMERDGEPDGVSAFSENVRFADALADKNLISAVDGNLLFDLAVSVLTPKERRVIWVIFFMGHSPSGAALELSVSAPRITQLMQSALKKLRLHLKHDASFLN